MLLDYRWLSAVPIHASPRARQFWTEGTAAEYRARSPQEVPVGVRPAGTGKASAGGVSRRRYGADRAAVVRGLCAATVPPARNRSASFHSQPARWTGIPPGHCVGSAIRGGGTGAHADPFDRRAGIHEHV